MLFLLIVVLSIVLQLFLPWWIIAPLAFMLSFWKAKSGKHAFLSGFLAIAFSWMLLALVKSIPNENLLANRIGQMLGLPEWDFNWLIVLLVTGIVGGLGAGFSGLAGYYWKLVLKKN